MLEHGTLADKVYICNYFRVTPCISDPGQQAAGESSPPNSAGSGNSNRSSITIRDLKSVGHRVNVPVLS
jgi:hypothetical protein